MAIIVGLKELGKPFVLDLVFHVSEGRLVVITGGPDARGA